MNGPCHLFVKLQSANPEGSIKDRVALSMISAAKAEATAGNTGFGLAQIAVGRYRGRQ
ncbi:MAG: cysK 1 [Proteobacteria bacterium]|nr:cysK 1 [Pseudomonadota bacterium]